MLGTGAAPRVWGIILTIISAIGFFPGTGLASSHVSATNALVASSTANQVQDVDGNEASTFVVVARTSVSTTLFIRICEWPVQLCTEYVQEIPDADYQLDTFNSWGRLRTSVNGLGSVNVDIRSVWESGHVITCLDIIATRSSTSFVGEMAADAIGGYGGQIGPWTLTGGYCGINGRNVQVLTSSG